MVSPQAGMLRRDLKAIFDGSDLRAESDGALVERFLGERDQARESAFEALVERHGPMVERVCRRVLGDGHEAQDVFQAVFLVLARRAGSVRRRESLGSWLHGVALRVAARARARLHRMRAREQPAGGLADLEASGQVAGPTGYPAAEAVHQEVQRLTAKFRAPIVLCYLEGLTHDEAAARLNWPVGTVRSRLSRGRDQLRDRLVRRGMSTAGALAALAAWLGLEADAHAAAGLPVHAPPALSPSVITATARSACTFAAGGSGLTAHLTATSLALTQEVLRTMTLQRLALFGLALLPAGMLATAGIVIGHEPGPGQDPQPAVAAVRPAQPASAATPKPKEPDPLLPALNLAALDRFEFQRKAYLEGRITIDRIIMASQRWMEVEQLLAENEVKRVRAIKDHVDRLKQIEERERAELAVGRSTAADEVEIREARLEAELSLRRALESKPARTVEALSARVAELEKRIQALEGATGGRSQEEYVKGARP